MINLLTETEAILAQHGKTPADVKWVGSADGTKASTWADWAEVANRDYDNELWRINVATDLVVVGNNFWLERHNYDGIEWWEFKKLPKLVRNPASLTCVFVADLEDAN